MSITANCASLEVSVCDAFPTFPSHPNSRRSPIVPSRNCLFIIAHNLHSVEISIRTFILCSVQHYTTVPMHQRDTILVFSKVQTGAGEPATSQSHEGFPTPKFHIDIPTIATDTRAARAGSLCFSRRFQGCFALNMVLANSFIFTIQKTSYLRVPLGLVSIHPSCYNEFS